MGTLDPLQVFPLEVWKMIFEEVGKQQGFPMNLLNISRASTTFQDMLEPTQSQWLFESVFPLVFPYMEQKQILACRTVCKEWCRVVDTFLEDFETRRPFSKDTNISNSFHGTDKVLREKGLQWTCLGRIEELTEFMGNMNNSKNPFIGGSLWFLYPDTDLDSDAEDDDEPGEVDAARENRQMLFWKKVSEFLAVFGERVKYIRFSSFTSDAVNAKDFYVLLRQYLLCLPNLRGIRLDMKFSFFGQDTSENCGILRELKEFLERDSSTLPEISSLETLAIYSDGLPRCICEKLISSLNPRKLKSLKLHIKPLPVEGTMINLSERLPSLTELQLLGVKSFEHFQNYLNNLVGEGAPLGKLDVLFNSEYTDAREAITEINFDLVCEAISKFGRTLEVLSLLGFASFENFSQLPNPTLHMLKIPHVRSLELDSLTFGPGPGFLPANFAPSLEYLIIEISDPDEGIALGRRQGPGTEFYKGAVDGELCYSQVWNHLPKLKGVKVIVPCIDQTATCTRAMHETGVPSPPLNLDLYASSDSD